MKQKKMLCGKKATNSMNNPDAFLAKVKNYRGEDISPEILAIAGPFVDDPEK